MAQRNPATKSGVLNLGWIPDQKINKEDIFWKAIY